MSLSDRQQKTAPRILRSLDHVKAADVVGDEPSDELLDVSFAEFDITNLDVFPVAYSIRTKVNIFTVQHNQAYGFLRPREKTTIRLWLKSSEAWSRGTEDYMMKRIPIMVMSVRVPENIRPNDDLSACEMARHIFQLTKERSPTNRYYLKIMAVLEHGSGV